jgi:hypothetical protein
MVDGVCGTFLAYAEPACGCMAYCTQALMLCSRHIQLSPKLDLIGECNTLPIALVLLLLLLCSNINQDTLVAVPEGMDGAKVASHHYLLAPVYMRPAAPGLAGKDAHSLVPDAVAIDEAMRPFVKAGKVLNYTALREWWLPRHQAWTADPTKVTLIDQVLAWLTSEAAWQPRTAEPHKEQGIVEEKGAKPEPVQ